LIGVSSSLLFDREKADNYGSNGWFLNPHDCTLYAKQDNIWKHANYNKNIVKNDVIQVRLTDDGPHQSHDHVSYSINGHDSGVVNKQQHHLQHLLPAFEFGYQNDSVELLP
jgi:hypothetical protein